MGLNQFAIYSEEEFAERFLNLKYSKIHSVAEIKDDSNHQAVIVDWVEKGAVGPVKNQGACGSAVLYSTIGGL